MPISPSKENRPADTASSLLTSPAFGCCVFCLVFLIFLIVAVPAFLKPQLRALVPKAQSALASLETAVFDYHHALVAAGKEGIIPPAGGIAQPGWKRWTNDVDFGPPNAPHNSVNACSVLWIEGSFYDDAGDRTVADAAPVPNTLTHYDLRVMTSPIETIFSVPTDPFKNDGGPTGHYDYFALGIPDVFAFRSLGPDRDADIGCGPEGFHCGCESGGDCLVEGESLGEEFGPGFSSLEEALRYGPGVYSPTNGLRSSGDFWRLSTLPGDAYVSYD